MSLENVASRYAQALFEIGTEQGNLTELARQFRDIGETYASSSELRSVLDNPIVDEKSRRAILEEVAQRTGAGPVAKNALGLLAERRRLAILPYLARALDRLNDEKAGIVRAVVTAAQDVSEAYVQKLRAELEKKTGKKVVVEKRVDPTLLGGVVARIGDRVLDGSLKTRLERLRASLQDA